MTLLAARYRELLRTPGAPRLVAAGLLAGVGSAMAPVALVLFARPATGSFGAALSGQLVDGAGTRVAFAAAAGAAAPAALVALARHVARGLRQDGQRRTLTE